MTIIEAMLLGLVQGLTEFIPVSSSGHLIIAHELFDTTSDSLAFDVALHIGTLLALLLFFKKDIMKLLKNLFKKNKDGALARLILYATIPAVIVGLLFGGIIDDHARTTLVVACTLGVVGVIMLLSEKCASSSVDKDNVPSTKQGLIVGFAQSLALIPGVSRSGATMTAGFFVGMSREQAARFSFLLSIPIIAGSAAGIMIRDADSLNFDSTLLIGVITAFASGLFAIKFMLRIIGKVGLKPFAYYRIVMAAVVALFLV